MALYHKLEMGELLLVKYFEKKILKDNLIFFDVGTNRGLYIDLFLSIKKNMVIYGFEPIKSLYDVLNTKYNEKYNNIKINNYAISNLNGEHQFCELIDPVTDGCSSLVERSVFNERSWKYKKYDVKTVTLDKFCSDNDIEFIDFMKIDVEGYEVNVLKGATELLKNNKIGLIQFEYSITTFTDAKTSLLDVLNIAKKNNYTLFDFKNGLNEINLTNIKFYDKSIGCNYVLKSNDFIL